MIEILIGAVLAAGAVSYVLRPIFRPEAPDAARCRHCGTTLEAGAQFCSGCGARPAAQVD